MDFLPGMSNAVNLHPMFVHFPIVLILLALVFEVAYLIIKDEFYGKAAGFMLNLAAVSAVVALYFGYRAADILGHDSPFHDQVHGHRDIMVWFTWLTVAGAVIFQFVKPARKGVFRLITLVILTIFLIVGADRGAELVFRYGMGISAPTHDMMMSGQSHHDHDMDHDEDEPDEKSQHIHSDGSNHEH